MSLLEVLHNQYSTVANKLRRLYDLYADGDDNVLADTIADAKKELKNIQTQIENETEKNKNTSVMAGLHKTLTTLPETWEYMTPKERKLIVNDCINKITLMDSQIHVDYKFGTV
jgi:site-specific DNA recombinase